MSAFPPVELQWAGKITEVPPDKVMRLIAAVERHTTLGEITEMFSTGHLKFGVLAEAYSAALLVAGVRVSPPEIYQVLTDPENRKTSIPETLNSLTSIMLPTPKVQGAVAAAKPGNARKKAAASS